MADELTTVQDCAARWQVSESYARRILAPVDPVDRDPVTGAMRYRLDEAEAARTRQPGRGRRLDLATAPMSRDDARRLTEDESLPATHRALWALMQSGMRVSDALSLDVRDVHPGEKTAVVEASAKEPKTFPLSDSALKLLRQAAGGRSAGPLLADERGRPVSRYSAAKFAQAAAGVSIHAFKSRPHTMESPWQYVQAKDLQVSDTVRLGDLSGVVDVPPVHVTDPSGATKVKVTFRGTTGPVTWDADLWVAIAARSETAES
ncbi:tyrosine-type recombinase/integrase [Streptomyces sp. NPDC020883]|uniref:tyrosine-type recombinase/integrase n=1 Tax=Streptomyces sp. NPDC020883 TaxID=3365099 RepID=UPI0037A34642